MPGHGSNPLSHVLDHPSLEIPWFTPPNFELHIPLPSFLSIQITRYMVMELLAAVLVVLFFIPAVRRISRTQVTKGLFDNTLESMLLFIRDEVARPAIGEHGADKYLPFLWTIFLFILFMNLIGMIPGGASATGNINVTAALALLTLATVIRTGVREQGFKGYWLGLVPHLDVPGWMKLPLWGLMFFIEIAGLFIRHIVLAVRLFANMFAGHTVLAVILGFILMAYSSWWTLGVVAPASLVGVILLSLLELFVAFLQAYVFTFLSALFIGSSLHSH